MSEQTEKHEDSPISIILFYKYHPLSSSQDLMEPYRVAMEAMCQNLELKGRVLLGCSETEGINGTLAGREADVRIFTYALLGEDYVKHHCADDESLSEATNIVLQQFWGASQKFSQAARVPILTMDSPEDFKWSSSNRKDLFPDLVVKLVKEIIGTGGVLSQIPLQETAQGYLTPQEWHKEMLDLDTSKTVLIDCRNTKECAIGHFPEAIDPKTTTFSQFPQWAKEHAPQLQGKRVLMYCTGGIRCEKASAYLRRQGVSKVQHLKGGIHKYLEAYGEDGMWKGKNFVFDGRGAASAEETQLAKDGCVGEVSGRNVPEQDIVGQCLYCCRPYDTFHPYCVCTVCREPTLVCSSCQDSLKEYHCSDHFHLHTCYFTNLTNFSKNELMQQLEELEQHLDKIAIGKRYKQKRKTLYKQCDKIRAQLFVCGSNNAQTSIVCRNCRQIDCSGDCWGFHGLKRKELLETQNENEAAYDIKKKVTPLSCRAGRRSAGQRVSKQFQRQRVIQEIEELQLSEPPSHHVRLGIRVPPPCTRVLETLVKGKWCGRRVIEVLQSEFAELAKPKVFQRMLDGGLLRLNDVPLTNETVYTKLKNMDVISRIVHWHEPPVRNPDAIGVQKNTLPDSDSLLYVCDKPSSVPVHPAGPYLSNTLTMMVEAQEGLATRSLIPCHRIDRVTSGLTLCCTDVNIARIIQGKLDEGCVRKLYVARVQGRFPQSVRDAAPCSKISSFAKWSWVERPSCIEVDAPVETIDAGNGIRIVSSEGKPSRSRFQCLAYDEANNWSLVACAPLTGRGHQLRVHLQWLGFPIDGDLPYGGQKLNSDCTALAIQRMMEAMTSKDSSNLALDSISKDDAIAAKAACLCCNGKEEDIVSSFTPAQLLTGSEICLHALRYEITFSRRKRKATQGCREVDKILKVEVGVPKWASEFGSVDIAWLQDSIDSKSL